jgi:hypothetical protein
VTKDKVKWKSSVRLHLKVFIWKLVVSMQTRRKIFRLVFRYVLSRKNKNFGRVSTMAPILIVVGNDYTYGFVKNDSGNMRKESGLWAQQQKNINTKDTKYSATADICIWSHITQLVKLEQTVRF